jgi:hypothetical protein
MMKIPGYSHSGSQGSREELGQRLTETGAVIYTWDDVVVRVHSRAPLKLSGVALRVSRSQSRNPFFTLVLLCHKTISSAVLSKYLCTLRAALQLSIRARL